MGGELFSLYKTLNSLTPERVQRAVYAPGSKFQVLFTYWTYLLTPQIKDVGLFQILESISIHLANNCMHALDTLPTEMSPHHPMVVIGNLPGYFTKPYKWLQLNVSRIYRAMVHHDPCPSVSLVWQKKRGFLRLFEHTNCAVWQKDVRVQNIFACKDDRLFCSVSTTLDRAGEEPQLFHFVYKMSNF